MKKSFIVLLLILSTMNLFGWTNTSQTGNMGSKSPQNGQFFRDDGSWFNLAEKQEAGISVLGGDMEVIQFTHDLSSGALDYTTSIGQDFIVHQIFMNFNQAISEDLDIKVAYTDSTYDTKIEDSSLVSVQYWVWEDVDGKIFAYSPDQDDAELNITVSNATATTTNAAFTIVYSLR